MADENFEETPIEDVPEGEKNNGSLTTIAIFGIGIFLLITLLYFAY